MQVNLLGLAQARTRSGLAGGALVANLLKLTAVSPQTQTLRKQCDEEDERRRANERDPQSSLMAGAAQSPTQIMQDAERDMAPGSQAAKHRTLADLQQGALQQRPSFQATLADATSRQSGRTAETASPSSNQPVRAPASPPAAPSEAASQEATPNPSPSAVVEPSKPNVVSNATQAGAAASVGAQASEVFGLAPVCPPPVASAIRAVPTAQAVEAVTATREVPASSSAPPSSEVTKSSGDAVAALTEAREPAAKTGAGASRTAPPEASETGNSDANLERIVRVLRAQIGQDRARATLRLDPPELGTVKLHMDLQKDVLSLRIDTQTTTAHRLLSEQVDSLRRGLEATGIQLERVEIRPPDAAAQPAPFERQSQPDANTGGHGGGASDTNAEHSAEPGTESSGALFHDTSGRDGITEPAAESLVNILA